MFQKALLVVLLFSTSVTQAAIKNTSQDYYATGFQKAQDKDKALAAIAQLEKSLQTIYTDFSTSIKQIEKQQPVSFFEKLKLAADHAYASNALISAEKKFLLSLDVSESEIKPETAPNEEFLSFLHGVSDATGYYIASSMKGRNRDGFPPLYFPEFCFADSFQQEQIQVTPEITSFLTKNAFKNQLTDNLYEIKTAAIPKVTIEKTRSYAMDGISESCGNYGKIDQRLPQQKVLIFADTIKARSYLKKRPELVATFFQEIETHELMHYFTKNSCSNLGSREVSINNVLYSQRRINEALASIGAISVFTSTQDENKKYILFNEFYSAGDSSYGLTFDLFFIPIYAKAARDEFNKLQKTAQAGGKLTAKDMPPYMKLVSQSTADSLGTLTVDGEEKFVSVPPMYSNFSLTYDPLLDVSDGEVLSAAENALATILSVQNSLCVE